jgi:hypothetical protein
MQESATTVTGTRDQKGKPQRAWSRPTCRRLPTGDTAATTFVSFGPNDGTAYYSTPTYYTPTTSGFYTIG